MHNKSQNSQLTRFKFIPETRFLGVACAVREGEFTWWTPVFTGTLLGGTCHVLVGSLGFGNGCRRGVPTSTGAFLNKCT